MVMKEPPAPSLPLLGQIRCDHDWELGWFELAPGANSGRMQETGGSLEGVKPGEEKSRYQLQSAFPQEV